MHGVLEICERSVGGTARKACMACGALTTCGRYGSVQEASWKTWNVSETFQERYRDVRRDDGEFRKRGRSVS